MTAPISIRSERRAGDDALIVELHRLGYTPEGPRFGAAFCDFVAETVSEANLADPANGRVWFAERDGETLGCAAMITRGDEGQLRWVVLRPEARGLGCGRALVDRAMDHARHLRFKRVFLETTDGLDASMAIYRKLGFVDVHNAPAQLWHGEGQLIVMSLNL